MKALILNSGTGSRMGALTKEHPKCMTEISARDTILGRQLALLAAAGIQDVVITTGLFDEILMDFSWSLGLPIEFTFIKNPVFRETNYIYSIYCAREHLEDDIVLMHGDLVFDESVLRSLLDSQASCMVVSTKQPLPEKDFKAVVIGGRIVKIGIEFFENAVAAQPLYKFRQKDWCIWLDSIASFCEAGCVRCYAENAFNEVSNRCCVLPVDVGDALCNEIDTAEDLRLIRERLKEEQV